MARKVKRALSSTTTAMFLVNWGSERGGGNFRFFLVRIGLLVSGRFHKGGSIRIVVTF